MGTAHSIHQVRHGHAYRGKKSPTYRRWLSMLSRTRYAKDAKRYSDREISVCERWHDFTAFLADMGECPDGLTLDRIDNNKGYEPANCRWADAVAQNRNRSIARMLTYNGETLNMQEWANRLGILQGTLSRRINKYGWSVERALSTDPSAYWKRGSK